MRLKSSHAGTRIAAALAVSTLPVAFAVPAQARAHLAEVTTCTSSIANTTVDDVVVAQGSNCTITNTHIRGTLRMTLGGSVTVENSTVDRLATIQATQVYWNNTDAKGGLLLQGATLIGDHSTFSKGIRGTDEIILSLTNSLVKGDITAAKSTMESAIYTHNTEVRGSVVLEEAYASLDKSTFRREVIVRSGPGGQFTRNTAKSDVTLTADRSDASNYLCGNTFAKDATVSTQGRLLFGVRDATGFCAGNTVKGDVALTAGNAEVWNNTVRGDAAGRFGTVVGGGNTVGGRISGNFPK